MSYLDNEVVKVHAKDSTNYGTKLPYRNAYAEYNEIRGTNSRSGHAGTSVGIRDT